MGAVGSGLGYEGIANSLAVKFDIMPNGSTTGVYTNGISPIGGLTELTPGGVNLRSGNTFSCTLTYDGNDLTQTLVDINSGDSFVHTYTGIDLPPSSAARPPGSGSRLPRRR